MNKILSTFILIFIVISGIYSQTEQTNPTDHITETVSFITDRDLYLAGEELWFSANCLLNDKLSNEQLSNILYIELYDQQNTSHLRKKFQIKNGKVTGMLNIPAELNSGHYFIRAYTQYQRNSLAETFHTHYIAVLNPTLSLPAKSQLEHETKIFPEFGFLMANTSNKVAIIYEDNVLKSWVEDQEKKLIGEITLFNRIGMFEFKALESSIYTLCSLTNNDTLRQAFPEVVIKEIGMHSSFNPSKDEFIVDIIYNQANQTNAKFEVYSKHFNKIYEESVFLNKTLNTISIPYKELGAGFNYLVLRNSHNQIIGIQSHFKFRDIVEVDIIADQEIYQKRNKISLQINADKEVEFTNLSISVTKKGTLNTDETGLPAYILKNPILIEGYLAQHPEFMNVYKKDIEALLISFNSKLANNEELKQKLNNFSYRIDWLPEIRDVSVSGFLKYKGSDDPVVNTEIYASVFNTNPQVHFQTTDQNGAFIFSLNNLTETRDVFLNVNRKEGDERDIELLINKDFSSTYPPLEAVDFIVDSNQVPFIEQLYLNHQVSNAFNTEMAQMKEPVSKLPFSFAKPEFSINLDDYVENPSLEVIFRELIPLVKVHRKANDYSLSVTDPVLRTAQSNPLIMVDYITIFNVNELMNIDPSVIQKIDLYTSPFILGNSQLNGVILITTKTDNFGGMKMPSESAFFEYTTISDSYEFNATAYDEPAKYSSREANFRSLLYWDGDLNPNELKNINFFASDHCSEYDIVVRGKTSDGKWCFGKSSIMVVK